MERRAFLAILLSFGIYFGWQKFYIEPQILAQQQAAQNTVAPTQAAQASTAQAAKQTIATTPVEKKSTLSAAKPAQTATIATSLGDVTLSDQGPAIKGWKLRNYPVTLNEVTHQDGLLEIAFDDPTLGYLTQVQGALRAESGRAEWSFEDERVRMIRTVSASANRPELDIMFRADFKSKTPKFAYVFLQASGNKDHADAQDQQALLYTAGSLERISLNDSFTQKEFLTPVNYVGANSRYFLVSLLAQAPHEPKGLLQPLSPSGARASLVFPITANSVSIPVRALLAPKDLAVLRAVDPKLDATIDFGWFTVFAYPLLKLLKFLNQFVHNYGVAIILLTLLLKVVTFPLTYKSMKSMKEMARLQPQLTRLREKYKDDKEALNREMLTLMRSNGYNPAAGCLPLLVQMPIFFALYRVLYSSIELYQAPFGFWIHDLSIKDPYYITPILLTVTMYIQQKLTPNTATDPMQQKMLQFMPLLFGFMMISLPAGLAIYMFVNALASIVQQFFLNKKLDIGNATPAVSRA